MKTLIKFNYCFCLILSIIISRNSLSQEFNFSLFNQNKTYYNPAFSGLEKGLINTNFIYRRQWLNLPGEFSIKHFNINWKNYSSNGFGIFLISDIKGDSFLTTNSFGINYTWQGNIDKFSGTFFQIGLKTSYNENKIDFTKLTFSDQLDEIYGKIYGSSFVVDQNKYNYIDFSVGALIQFNTSTRRSRMFTNTIGFAFHHFTRPNESFQGSKVKIPLKITAHAQSQYRTAVFSFNRKDNFHISPWVLFESKGGVFQKEESTNNLMSGVVFISDPITGGITYKSHLSEGEDNERSLVFQLGTHLYSSNEKYTYRIFYSYDLAINNYTKYTRYSHEIGFTIDVHFKRRYKCINEF